MRTTEIIWKRYVFYFLKVFLSESTVFTHLVPLLVTYFPASRGLSSNLLDCVIGSVFYHIVPYQKHRTRDVIETTNCRFFRSYLFTENVLRKTQEMALATKFEKFHGPS